MLSYKSNTISTKFSIFTVSIPIPSTEASLFSCSFSFSISSESVRPEARWWRIKAARSNIAEAMEVKQLVARWALSIRTQVSCLSFLLPRWPVSLVRLNSGKSIMMWKSSSIEPSNYTINQFGFSIFTTTGMPRWLSFAHHWNDDDQLGFEFLNLFLFLL